MQNALALKLSSSGKVQWAKTYEISAATGQFNSAHQTSDGGYAFAGYYYITRVATTAVTVPGSAEQTPTATFSRRRHMGMPPRPRNSKRSPRLATAASLLEDGRSRSTISLKATS
jgi:hypothetical protein